jgi:hypothetical protein
MTMKIVQSHKELLIKEMEESGIDPVLFSRLVVVALTSLAATYAVDINMPYDGFGRTCQANYAEANRRAPRFS